MVAVRAQFFIYLLVLIIHLTDLETIDSQTFSCRFLLKGGTLLVGKGHALNTRITYWGARFPTLCEEEKPALDALR